MARMLPGIETVEQHQQLLGDDPDAYRPERCPRCAKAGMHHHGHYERNVPRGEGLALALGALFIPRFLCPYRQRRGSYMVRPAMQGKSSFVAERILRPYIRPWDEASCRLWP